MAERVSRAKERSELNGIEGKAAQAFFQGLAAVLPTEYAFGGRKRRPPPDPFNAMLSLGYTLLYQRTDSILRAAGLLPDIGIYHQTHGRHSALASDLMECFRHLVERQALSMLNRGELKPGDFDAEGAHGCRIQRDALGRYLGALSARFLDPLEDAGTGQRGSHHQHLWRMAHALIRCIDGPTNGFTAFRTR